MLEDIVDIYKDITFEEEHWQECVANDMTVADMLRDGMLPVTVELDLKHYDTHIPDGFDTKYEAYSLSVKRSEVANEGIKAVVQADYYPGMVRGLDSLFQLFETAENTTNPNLYEINYLPITV